MKTCYTFPLAFGRMRSYTVGIRSATGERDGTEQDELLPGLSWKRCLVADCAHKEVLQAKASRHASAACRVDGARDIRPLVPAVMSKPKGGAREGAGPKPKYDEPMRPRTIRMTDEQWEESKLVGWDWIRAAVKRQAKRLNKEK